MTKLTVLSILLLLGALCISQVESRHVSRLVNFNTFSKSKWQFLTRFTCAEGTCHYKFKFKLDKPVKELYPDQDVLKLNILVFTADFTWPEVMNYQSIYERSRRTQSTKIAELPTDARESQHYHHTLYAMKQRVYYLFLADPNDETGSKQSPGNRFRIDLEITNVDGSHLSEEENGLQTPHLLLSVALAAFVFWNFKKVRAHYKKEQEFDYPMFILNFACIIECIALFMEWIQMVVSESNGEGHIIPNFFSGLCSVLAQLILTCLLVLLASGWTITYLKFEDIDFAIMLGTLVAFVHIFFVIFGHIHDEDPYQVHDYGSWPGMVLLIFKMLFFGVFLFFIFYTIKKADARIKMFLIQLGVLGSIYILSIPLIVLFATTFVDVHYQHKTITIGNILLQTVTIAFLTYLFSSEKSRYYSVSVKGRSNLPSFTNKWQ